MAARLHVPACLGGGDGRSVGSEVDLKNEKKMFSSRSTLGVEHKAALEFLWKVSLQRVRGGEGVEGRRRWCFSTKVTSGLCRSVKRRELDRFLRRQD